MLIGKLGNFSLYFSFLFTFFVLANITSEIKKDNKTNQLLYSLSFLQLFFIFLSFFCLIFSFVISDFSLVSVYENSHTDKPLIYKISGTWGNHEGSLLLWLIVLIFISFIFLITTKNLDKKYRLKTLFIQNIIIFGFLSFSIFTSNPFIELVPIPKQGLGLNPILQDPALAVHPPILYIGYVGSSIFFSSALGAMLNNSVNKEWAQSIKPWILISWVFLTLGILLGSIWAYYELGWGGFWFWDPVENASLMPWLASTALLHSVMVFEKRGTLHSWTIVLAIITFTLSVTGTFLVRSGILNSVHTFANDPARGLYILTFLVSLSFVAIIIFFWNKPKENINEGFHFTSKETFILINNWFIIFFLITVLLGTVYPIFLEVIVGAKISVGYPFYNIVIIPFVIPFLIFMTIGPKLSWIRTDIKTLRSELTKLLFLSLIASIILFFLIKNINLFTFIIFLSVFLLILSLIKEIFVFSKQKLSINFFRIFSHLGFGFFILSVALNSNLSIEKNLNITVGNKFKVHNYDILFENITGKSKTNYNAIVGKFNVLENGREISILNPEIRVYSNPRTVTIEASIKSSFFSDLYITMSSIPDTDFFNVKFQYKPFMMWIWLSVVMIALGGILSLFKTFKRVK